MAPRLHPDVAIGVDAALAQGMSRHDPARERVVAVEGHARAAQLLGRRLPSAGRDQQVGAVERTILASRHGCGEGLDRRAGIAHARVGQPAHEQQGGRSRDDGGKLCERRLAQRREGRSRLRCDRAGHGLVVRARDLAEEAVDGEFPHPRSVAPCGVFSTR